MTDAYIDQRASCSSFYTWCVHIIEIRYLISFVLKITFMSLSASSTSGSATFIDSFVFSGVSKS